MKHVGMVASVVLEKTNKQILVPICYSNFGTEFSFNQFGKKNNNKHFN